MTLETRAPDCIIEYGPCTCEYGHICHESANVSKIRVSPAIRVAFCLPNAAGTVEGEAATWIWYSAGRAGVTLVTPTADA